MFDDVRRHRSGRQLAVRVNGLSVVALAVVLVPSGASAAATQPLQLVNGLVRASDCEYCHSFNNLPVDAAEPMYAPFFTWRGSMMANSAKDPVFWAGVAIASQDAPGETQECVRCHAPRAFLEGRGDAIAIDELVIEDLAGVECEACHRMVADEAPGNARYTIDDTLVGDNVPRRGPWDYPMDGGIPAPPHEVLVDAFVGSSELCGTCHDVTTGRERVDENGVGLGIGFNEQRTYSEWAGSDFAVAGAGFRSCQDCHMPAVDDAPGCRDNVMSGSVHPTGGRRHDLVGANRFVVELLAAEATVVQSVAFDHTLEQIDAFLPTAATLAVEGPDTVDLAAGLDGLRVRVTNETGHKLPTGYAEGRVMWLEVVARAGETEVWSSGVWDADAQTIGDDAQLRTYQAVAEEHLSGETLHLLRNDRWIEDTRIPPRGLAPSIETDPVGDRYALGADGKWPNFDEHTYVWQGRPELAETGELTVHVRLLYLVNTPEYIEFLAAANETNEAGNDVAALFEAAGGAVPLVLAEQELTIPIASEPDGGSSSSGASDDGSDTSEGGTTVTTTGTTAGATQGSTADNTAATDEPDPPQQGGDGCGCRHEGGPTAAWLLALLLFPAARRREATR
jgi:MYXO-CTERM domain-containing protein